MRINRPLFALPIALALYGCPAPVPQLPVVCRLWVGTGALTKAADAGAGAGQDAAKPVFGGAAIAGLLGREVGGSKWDIDGAAGAIAAGRVVNATIDLLTDLKSLTASPARGSVAPTFINSNVTVHTSFGTAKLGLVQVLNNDAPFGLFAPNFKLVEYTPLGGVKFKLTPTTVLPVLDEDFSIAQP